MDSKTNCASTKDWVRVTRGMSITSYDPGQRKTNLTAQSTQPKRPKVSKAGQRPLSSQGREDWREGEGREAISRTAPGDSAKRR